MSTMKLTEIACANTVEEGDTTLKHYQLMHHQNHKTLLQQNQNKVMSEESSALSGATFFTSGSADLWSAISSINFQQTILPGDSIEYTIKVGNHGSDIANSVGFRHVPPTGLSNISWTCSNSTGDAICPILDALENIDLLLDLPVNSSLEFIFNAEVVTINSFSLLITATITPPDNISDSDLITNI